MAAVTPWPRRRGAGRVAEGADDEAEGDENLGEEAPKPELGRLEGEADEGDCHERVRGEADLPLACVRFIEAGGWYSTAVSVA